MRSKEVLFLGLVFLILLLSFVFAGAPTWQGSDVNYTTNEGSFYYHNLSANITNYSGGVTFAINTLQTNITWINASGTFNVTESTVSAWIKIYNTLTGNLTINATYDNQTGFFSIPIEAKNTTDNEAQTTIFEFIINATNDAPNLTNINSTYNFSVATPLLNYLNASDEESHFPLIFNVTFNSTSCTHASWSPYSNGQNCSLFDFGFTLTHPNNISALINFTPTNNHVGVYQANVSLRDSANLTGCPHAFCDKSTYGQNKTIYYSQIVTFNVLGSLEVNISSCQNKIFQENQAGSCNITVRAQGTADNLNLSSYASLRNYATGQSGVSNTSWFYANNSATTSNFAYNITVNVTPGKTEIGNWTINFTVRDTTYSETNVTQIQVYVNRTTNDIPDFLSVSNVSTSINLLTVVNFTVHDDDLLAPDKNQSYGGFNETITFNRTILNQSNLSQTLTLSDFSITVLQMPVSGTNRTTAEIRFTPSSSDAGSYTINATVRDNDNALDFVTFNLTILNNSYPQWTIPLNTTLILTEGVQFYLNLSQNATDPDGNTLTFSYANDTAFPSFSLNSTTGIINFTPADGDVGQHIVNITLNDGYLTNTSSFNFTVHNVNDNVSVLYISTTNATPSQINNNSAGNTTEDNRTIFQLWIEDDDLRVPTVQKSYYNESFTLNLTIQGVNTSLFNFTIDSAWWPQPNSQLPLANQNRTAYLATFIPGQASIGNYNISIRITDLSNSSYFFYFTFSILNNSDAPNITNIDNQTSGVNRSFYLDINVTDEEDGNDTSGTLNNNFVFSYQFLSDGKTSGFLNSTTFNSTTGIINLTFNSTQDGKYHINISVNDTSGAVDYDDFWFFVYGVPNVTSPGSGSVLNFTENSLSVLNFTVNHSVGDNLTYAFYMDMVTCSYQSTSNCNYSSSILRNLTNYYGNGTTYNFSFRFNFSDETYGLLKNLTFVVYPNSSSLTNASSFNTTVIYKLNVSHADSPASFDDNIDDVSGPYGTPITINLYNHFSDYDHNDAYYVANLTFTPTISTASITSSVSSDGVLTLSASIAVTGNATVLGADSSSNVTSNSFDIAFTVPPQSSSSSSSSSGGGTTEVPVSLKLILPDPTSAFKKDRIVLPITLHNTGSSTLFGISLAGSVSRDGALTSDVNLSFSQTQIDSLSSGQKQNVTMVLEIDTDREGLIEITINATSKVPYYTDWSKLFLTIKEGESVEEKILFTEEFIVENPECIELTELVNEAKDLFSKGDREGAIAKADEALNACKEAISQAGKAKVKEIVENKLYRYLIISTIAAFAIGIAYYSYRRMKLRRMKGAFIQESIKNKKYLG